MARLPVNDQPTYFNDEAKAGALIGTAVMPVVGTAAGAVIGAGVGKNRMRHELVNGREVREPSALNLKAVIGTGKGLLLGTLLGIGLAIGATALLGLAVTSGTIAAIPAGIGLAVAYTPMLTGLIGAIRGGMKGSAQGKYEMQRDWQLAQQNAVSMAPARSKMKAVETALAPETNSPEKSYVQEIIKQRAEAATRQAAGPSVA